MRLFVLAACAALVASISAAHADRLFTPVYIKKTALSCKMLPELQYRERLIRDQRDEANSNEKFISAMTGFCGVIREGAWMFYDGSRGPYICLRPRRGADCVWLPRDAAGEIVELPPGGSKKMSCATWAKIVDQSTAKENQYKQAWRASMGEPSIASDFMQGMLSGVQGMVSRGPTSMNVRHANSCVLNYATGQERGRRLYAYQQCPALGAGRREADATEYSAIMKYIGEFCTGQ